MNPTDEKQRIARVQQGDTEVSFSPLVRKYNARLYRHIQKRLRDPEVAKDLTQETWLKAYRGIQTYRGESAFYSWLYRIAENVITDHFRRHATERASRHLIDDPHFRDTDTCPSQSLERKELRLHLKNAIKCLTKPRRDVFVLYYHHELPIKAIARLLNRSEGTIKTHLRNARLQLQELLTPYLNNSDIPADMKDLKTGVPEIDI
ncbi:RNA polymerase sigma factor [Candidatus Poribacteria bacterium]|nr:RNA polymerase sigma factor [Candidatus Poribacteria bacterium]